MDMELLQAIRGVIREENEPIKNEMQSINVRLDALESGQASMSARLGSLESGQASMSARLGSLESGQTSMSERLDRVEESLQVVRTSQMKVELEQYPRISAALDGIVGEIEKNKEQDARILVLENKTDNHSNRIWALEQAAKA